MVAWRWPILKKVEPRPVWSPPSLAMGTLESVSTEDPIVDPSGHVWNTENQRLPRLGGSIIMRPKAHGTTERPVQKNLRWGCDRRKADIICSFNRHRAEPSGYWKRTLFVMEVRLWKKPCTFYDSVSGLPLFTAGVGRTFEEFAKETEKHGWPSFRDAEVHWDNVRCLKSGEAVSISGTHLGHNIPDSKGNRYCINLVSIAGHRV